jgi:mannose/fructose/N-acetylgalactosamine-specific phosphotransferase system component IIC
MKKLTDILKERVPEVVGCFITPAIVGGLYTGLATGGNIKYMKYGAAVGTLIALGAVAKSIYLEDIKEIKPTKERILFEALY